MEDSRKLTKIVDHIAACKFCGQATIIKGAEDMTQDNIDHAAVMQCNCDAAEEYQKRHRNAEFAKANINEIFGDDADALRQYLHAAVDKMANGILSSAKVETTTGIKAEIVLKKFKYKVTRIETNKDTRES